MGPAAERPSHTPVRALRWMTPLLAALALLACDDADAGDDAGMDWDAGGDSDAGAGGDSDAGAGGDSDAGAGADSLAAVYADADLFCEQVGECGILSLAECLDGMPTEQEAQAAIDRAALSSAEQAACRRAVELSDRCALALSCEGLLGTGHYDVQLEQPTCVANDAEISQEACRQLPCAGESLEVWQHCRAFLRALLPPGG